MRVGCRHQLRSVPESPDTVPSTSSRHSPAMSMPAKAPRSDWAGVTAGASAPETLVQQVVARLNELGGNAPEEVPGREETIRFAMPKGLR